MSQTERFRKAIGRLDYFKPTPEDDSPLYVDGGESLYEFLDSSEEDGDDMDLCKQLTFGDLRELIAEISGNSA